VKALEIANKDSIQFMKDLLDSMLLNVAFVLLECVFHSLELLLMPGRRLVVKKHLLGSQKLLFLRLKKLLQGTFVAALVIGPLQMPAKVLQLMLIWRISG
jgi:hypothetical protein